MDGEYKIQVLMDPHPWDNKEKPFNWVILKWHKNTEIGKGSWVNSGFCGWEETTEKAWQKAKITFYEEIKYSDSKIYLEKKDKNRS
jgi:hypothetical protein